jgi:anti-sigma regulatory factor (Ser/Thr protein kinase)
MRAALRYGAHVDDAAHACSAHECGDLNLAGGAVTERIDAHGIGFSHAPFQNRAVPFSGPYAWGLSLDDASAGTRARSDFAAFVRSLGISEHFVGTAELVFGELLGNVVRHAPGPVEIYLDVERDALVLHVIDSGPPLALTEYRLPDELFSERGRGLFIVAALASNFRVNARARGNHISVTLDRAAS